jgi:hypothetical protein
MNEMEIEEVISRIIEGKLQAWDLWSKIMGLASAELAGEKRMEKQFQQS